MVIKKVGLGTVSKKDVGTGSGQIPDMNNFASLLTTSGYQKLPSGLIIQWGAVNIPSSGAGSVDVTYPIAYPSGYFGLWGVYVTGDPSTRFVGIDGGSSTNTKARITYNSPTINSIRWLSLGY